MNLHLEGEAAETAACALAHFFDEEFGIVTSRAAIQAQPAPGRRADPVAIAALVLSVPGAVLATMDLAERIRLKEKIGRLIALCRRQKEDSGTIVRLETATGLRDLAELTPDDVLDEAARML